MSQAQYVPKKVLKTINIEAEAIINKMIESMLILGVINDAKEITKKKTIINTKDMIKLVS